MGVDLSLQAGRVNGSTASARQKPYFRAIPCAGTTGWAAMKAGMKICVALAVTCVLSIAGLSGCADLGPVGESDVATNSAVSYMNAARRSNGLPAASPDPRLDRAALEQARYMAAAGEMTHTTRRGRDFASRKKDNEIKGTAAENVAYGANDIGRVMQMWMEFAAAPPQHARPALLAFRRRLGDRRQGQALLGDGARRIAPPVIWPSRCGRPCDLTFILR